MIWPAEASRRSYSVIRVSPGATSKTFCYAKLAAVTSRSLRPWPKYSPTPSMIRTTLKASCGSSATFKPTSKMTLTSANSPRSIDFSKSGRTKPRVSSQRWAVERRGRGGRAIQRSSSWSPASGRPVRSMSGPNGRSTTSMRILKDARGPVRRGMVNSLVGFRPERRSKTTHDRECSSRSGRGRSGTSLRVNSGSARWCPSCGVPSRPCPTPWTRHSSASSTRSLPSLAGTRRAAPSTAS